MMRQSCQASPGGDRKGRCREMTRSELVTVPSFSAQASAGSRMRQASTVSVARTASETIVSGQPRSAARTASAIHRERLCRSEAAARSAACFSAASRS